ncbi:gliotoxin biosynthesis protein GliK [Aspergillus pseudoustus]|uniref:gamma-glutamylcyclotransferase n=1 Tax=Aspergillus pseudoustus TaxID=1810923 RepID=A0ABR4JSE3_9EURO
MSESNDGSMIATSKAIWYFAYGSNTRSSVMRGRGIVPLDAQPVVVPSHRLCFDIFGIPYAEPAFASIVPIMLDATIDSPSGQAIPPVHGVAYLLTQDDYRRLVLSEGAGVGYDEITVCARIISLEEAGQDGEILAHTLQAKYPWRPNRAPSARYMNLIIDGANEFNLPYSYKSYLHSVPVYVPLRTYRSRFGAWLFLAFWRKAIRGLARLTKVSTDEKGHCPRWLGGVIVGVYWCMWGWHDFVHSVIWTQGDGVVPRR